SVSHLGRTVLFVSHQLGLLRQLCSRGIVLTAGRSASFESIEAALDHYLAGQDGNGVSADQQWKHIHSVWFDDSNQRNSHVFFGEPLVIRARVQNMPDFPAGFTVGITNTYGKLLCMFSTNPNDGVALPRKDSFKIVFRMDFC